MSTLNKQAISDHLTEAIEREELSVRQAAERLNLNPIYLTFAHNPKYWDSMGRTAWERLNLWHEGRCKLSEFVIPEGEELYVQKQYVPKTKPAAKPEFKTVLKDVAKAAPEDDSEMHLPEVKEARVEKKKKAPGHKKEINLIMNKAEMEALDKKFSPLFVQIENALSKISNIDQKVELQGKYLSEIYNDVEKLKKQPEPEPINATLKATWEDPKKKKKLRGWSIVFFQRNIYQK